MMDEVVYTYNQSNEKKIANHLMICDEIFIPNLSGRVCINDYAHKIFTEAQRFEAWINEDLVGLVAMYANAPDKYASYITNVSVLPDQQGQRIAFSLLIRCINHAKQLGFECIELEVDANNTVAIALYNKCNFVTQRVQNSSIIMAISLDKKVPTNFSRNYDVEIQNTVDHQYAYNFDFDVMHPYMVRSFQPFFRPGNLLELGSFKGDFTQRLLVHFDDITCVEASGEALKQAQKKIGAKVNYIHGVFETIQLPQRYDNIVLTHVLEHLDDPVRILRRINTEWLRPGGRLFLVCPNANAPSRQIAVKMGLITHNAAVTPAEFEHGHLCTYSLDTLERDAKAAGLRVMHRSGIFFKALANFQWDRLLNTDIISSDYLDGCYELGHHYPDLCSSIFLMCEQGC
jgi:2-polyprenyl-3-methyl-5-hydroxy-6-metoxy-1,4-benzoquinol methylase/GNAT superfamily N-acetyltransferase